MHTYAREIKKNKRLTTALVCVIVLVHNALEEHTMQITVTQAQALQHCAQQLVYVTDSTTNYAAIVANTRYSNDEVNENKYLEESY